MLKPSVEVHNANGILVGEFWDCLRLDPNAVQALRTKYEEHLRAGGKPVVVIDFLGVAFAGSASLGHFVALHRAARAKNGRLIFCNVDPTVFEVFRVSKLDPLFGFAVDRDAALAMAELPEPPAGDAGGDRTAEASTPGPVRKSGSGGLIRSSQRRKLSEG